MNALKTVRTIRSKPVPMSCTKMMLARPATSRMICMKSLY